MISPPRPRRPDPALRQALCGDRQAFARHPRLPRASPRACARSAISTPRIFAHSVADGLALIEDFGDETDRRRAAGPNPARYAEATALLADLHGRALPARTAGRRRDLRAADLRHRRDADRGRARARLVRAGGRRASIRPRARACSSSACGARLLAPILAAADDLDAARLSFAQPALARGPRGPAAARPDRFPGRGPRPARLRRRLAAAGRAGRRARRSRIAAARALRAPARGARSRLRRRAFAGAYAAMGAQRATKILGIFTRLDRRDGKPQYLQHLPRIERRLARNLAHPLLQPLQALVRGAACRARSATAGRRARSHEP